MIRGVLGLNVDRDSVFPLIAFDVAVINLAELDGKVHGRSCAYLIYVGHREPNPRIVGLDARYDWPRTRDMRENLLPDHQTILQPPLCPKQRGGMVVVPSLDANASISPPELSNFSQQRSRLLGVRNEIELKTLPFPTQSVRAHGRELRTGLANNRAVVKDIETEIVILPADGCPYIALLRPP